MPGLELAHFRVAPYENTLEGARSTSWLANLSAAVRPLVEGANAASPPPGVSGGVPIAAAYLDEARSLRGALEAARVPTFAIRSARLTPRGTARLVVFCRPNGSDARAPPPRNTRAPPGSARFTRAAACVDGEQAARCGNNLLLLQTLPRAARLNMDTCW